MSTREQLAQDTHAHAQKVAHALGEGWTYSNPRDGRSWTKDSELSWYATLTRGDGAGLHVSYDSHKLRYHWSAIYPRAQGQEHGPRRGEERQSITIGVDRTPEQAAKDIARRLLPVYLTQLAECLERVAAANAYQETTARNLQALADLLGVPLSKGNGLRDTAHTLYIRANDDDAYGDVKVSGDSITVELRNLSLEQAQRVLAVVRR